MQAHVLCLMRFMLPILFILFFSKNAFCQENPPKGQFRQGLSFPYIEYGSTKSQWTTPLPIAAFPFGYSYRLVSSVFFDVESLYVWNFNQPSEIIIQPGLGINLLANLVVDTRVGYRILNSKSFFHSFSANKIIPFKPFPFFLVTGIAVINNRFPSNSPLDSFQLLWYILIGVNIN
jgi:hypothetical protein